MKHLRLTLIGCILVACTFQLDTSQGQQDAEAHIQVYSYTELGYYTLNGSTPTEFKEFKAFEVELKKGVRPSTVKLNRDGNLEPRGELFTTRRKFKFITAIVGVEQKRLRRLTFRTVTLNGISYGFEGRFLAFPKHNKMAQAYTDLEGTLTKYQRGRKIAEVNLEFHLVANE